ncbi:hypothetical protein NDU88_008592 [Pleurodeles waltl]|uniref:Uncharacterized protein n=1 Tax=Pleurodeles waltl TaxID=8319 RepID=A0AAV7N5F5_PLEWA|nr:hypothetical protein NDU88_008591 [Pleurodeles waltl]KAJ1111256.1 hypothetical protein NDU88_008592 [Pleurodeles waltl]
MGTPVRTENVREECDGDPGEDRRMSCHTGHKAPGLGEQMAPVCGRSVMGTPLRTGECPGRTESPCLREVCDGGPGEDRECPVTKDTKHRAWENREPLSEEGV